MKKELFTRKLSLNKQTLSLLDNNAMQAIKGGLQSGSGCEVEYPAPSRGLTSCDLTNGCSDGCQSAPYAGCTATVA